MFGRLRTPVLAVVVATAAVACLPAAGTAAQSIHAIRVYGAHSQLLATFTSAKCVANGSRLTARASDGRYRDLDVVVKPFKGFSHSYQLHRGRNPSTYIEYGGPTGTYATDFAPPFPIHGGGAVHFADKGKLMGAGFSPTLNRAGSDAVTIAGVLECHYPAKKRH